LAARFGPPLGGTRPKAGGKPALRLPLGSPAFIHTQRQPPPNFQLSSRRRSRHHSRVAILGYIIVACGGYLLGSTPTGYLVARARGIDIRTVGSKNMGATNVFRTLGKGPGIFVLLVDALKGFAAVTLTLNFYRGFNDLLPQLFPGDGITDPQVRFGFGLVAGLAAVLGHNYTCWLQFKGGKGIATTAGVFLALAPAAVGIAIAVWVGALLATRYVSIASILAAVALPTAVWFTKENLALRLIAIILGTLAIYKHKPNIQRLINGTENRIHFTKPEGAK
jgi:glycerol-3-phosphate acyltransferase PlsY